MPSFKDIEETAHNTVLAEEVKAKGWLATHRRDIIIVLVFLTIGLILGKLV